MSAPQGEDVGVRSVTDAVRAAAPSGEVRILHVDDVPDLELGPLEDGLDIEHCGSVAELRRFVATGRAGRTIADVDAALIDLDLGESSLGHAQLGLSAFLTLRAEPAMRDLPTVLFTSALDTSRDLHAVLCAHAAGGPVAWFPKHDRSRRSRLFAFLVAAARARRAGVPVGVPEGDGFVRIHPVDVQLGLRRVPLCDVLTGTPWHTSLWTELRNGADVRQAYRTATDKQDGQVPAGVNTSADGFLNKSHLAPTASGIRNLVQRERVKLHELGRRNVPVIQTNKTGLSVDIEWMAATYGPVLASADAQGLG